MGLLSWNELENVDLHRHITYQNDHLPKPDFMQLLPDPYLPPCRRQGLGRLPRHHPEPQGPPYSDLSYLKKILLPYLVVVSALYQQEGGIKEAKRDTFIDIVYKNALPDITFIDYM